MAKPKEGKSDEFYKGKIRELASENRNLKKRIKKYERKAHFFEESKLEPEDVAPPIDLKRYCPECNKGTLENYTVVGRHWDECSQCNYRSKTIKT